MGGTMEHINLRRRNSNSTVVSNLFIDEYMTSANEAQIKIYLYLLRCIGDNLPVSVSSIADRYNYTEKDILRALMYWDKVGVLSIDFDSNNNVVGIWLNDLLTNNNSRNTAVITPTENSAVKPVSTALSAPYTKSFYSADQMSSFKKKDGVEELLFITEQYMGKPLGNLDINTLLYINEALHFPISLMEYLIEYCINAGHKNMNYIEKVAIAWAENGVSSIEEAKALSYGKYRKECFDVLRAFGITGRNIVDSDVSSVSHWIEDYNFTMDIILEACKRTIIAISKPSFSYADSILKNWFSNEVKTLDDIKELDEKFNSTKNFTNKDTRSSVKNLLNHKKSISNFKERDDDFDAIAMNLIESQIPLSN